MYVYICEADTIDWKNEIISLCKYHTLNITELSNGRRMLTATFAKCNLHKWNTLYAY